jgi:hypothetical protein
MACSTVNFTCKLYQVSAKGCQGFRGTKTRNGGRVFLAVENLYVQIKNRVAFFASNHSATLDSCIRKLFASNEDMMCIILIF